MQTCWDEMPFFKMGLAYRISRIVVLQMVVLITQNVDRFGEFSASDNLTAAGPVEFGTTVAAL